MYAWLLWLAAAGVLGAAEMLTLGLFLAPFALAALVAGALTALGAGFSVSVAVFALASVLLMFSLRPLVLGRLRAPVGIRTGTAALVGSRAVVLERIAFPHAGAVQIGGEVWTARAYGEDEVIEPGVLVYVIEIRGAIALVSE
jgi:membrane protein implicated in regulation of membrane protease activity